MGTMHRRMAEISARKRQILELAAEGSTDKEIAQKLGISIETVLSHWKELRTQLGAPSRTAVLAQILSQDQSKQTALAEAERDELLFQLAESNHLRAELAEANEQLRQLTSRQANLMGETISKTDKKMSKVTTRLAHLEHLNDLTKKTRTLIHSGEYGASWRKYFMSESIEFSGTTTEQWVNGEVNFFDYMEPKYIERNIPQFAPFSQGTHRLALAYKVKTSNGDRHLLDLLTCEIPDDTGTGTYHGVTLDITEWSDSLIRLVNCGHIEPRDP